MQENRESPNYYAIIPADVRYDENLRAYEKILYGEITALSNKTGVCYASNNYFARLYKVTPAAVSQWINHLKTNNYIDVDYFKENNQIRYRAIRLRGINKCEYLLTKVKEGYLQKFKENNTSNNNIDEYIKPEIFEYNWLGDDEDED